MRNTAKEEILKNLCLADRPLAVHEISVPMSSATAVSARLREMSRDGLVVGVRRAGKPYKEWSAVALSDFKQK